MITKTFLPVYATRRFGTSVLTSFILYFKKQTKTKYCIYVYTVKYFWWQNILPNVISVKQQTRVDIDDASVRYALIMLWPIQLVAQVLHIASLPYQRNLNVCFGSSKVRRTLLIHMWQQATKHTIHVICAVFIEEVLIAELLRWPLKVQRLLNLSHVAVAIAVGTVILLFIYY